MVIDMNVSSLETIEQIQEFLNGTTEVAFSNPADKSTLRTFVTIVIRRYRYFRLTKGQRGVLFAYMQRLTGYSRQHLSRLIAQYRHTKSLKPMKRTSRTSFARIYEPEDVALLAEIDSLHDTLSGPATKVLLIRAATMFGDQRFARLSRISVSHLYNLRASVRYRKHRLVRNGTRPAPVAIGIRKAPAPEGLPGYIRIDTVHQGDLDGVKGVYHINAVDIVTQWEQAASVEQISEAYLLPVIALLLDGFPFEIRGFHSDSGSEYVNYKTAGMLEKLRIEFTKSRPLIPTTTRSPNARTARSCARPWATATSRKNTPLPSIASIRRCSIPISTSTGPATSPWNKLTRRERFERPTHTTRS
jgi:hypothetical protein